MLQQALLRAQVRVWNIPEQRVVDYADVHEMVTATAFAPDGRRAVVGTMKGRCRFYACEANFRLEYQAQIGARVPALGFHAVLKTLNPTLLSRLLLVLPKSVAASVGKDCNG